MAAARRSVMAWNFCHLFLKIGPYLKATSTPVSMVTTDADTVWLNKSAVHQFVINEETIITVVRMSLCSLALIGYTHQCFYDDEQPTSDHAWSGGFHSNQSPRFRANPSMHLCFSASRRDVFITFKETAAVTLRWLNRVSMATAKCHQILVNETVSVFSLWCHLYLQWGQRS